MKQEKKAKIIIISIIIIATLIFLFFIAEIILLKQEQTEKMQENQNNQLAIENKNQQENIVNNEQNQNNNTEVIVPIIPTINNTIDTNTSEPTEKVLLSQNYYYSQLSSNGKIIYDKLKKNKEQFVTGNYSFDFGTQFNTLLHTTNGEVELGQDFQSAWNAFYYDEADLFYVDTNKITLIKEETTIGGITSYSVSIGPGNSGNYLKDEFQTKEQIEEANAYLQNIVDQIAEQTKQDTAAVKARKIHDWLASVVEYDKEGNTPNKFHIYGALYEGKAVCEGYARSYKFLLEQVGIPCILVAGTATNAQEQTEEHAWNYVQVNSQWYAVDVTWDDPIVEGGGTLGEDARTRYFLKGSENFFKDHTEDGVISENSMKFQYPILSMGDYK